MHRINAIKTDMIDQSSIDAFDKDGVVVLRGLFTDHVDLIRQGIEDRLREHWFPVLRQ